MKTTMKMKTMTMTNKFLARIGEIFTPQKVKKTLHTTTLARIGDFFTPQKVKKTLHTTTLTCVVILSMCVCAQASTLTDTANRDWLELVRQYTSADTLTDAEDSYRWHKLVQDSSVSGTSSFLAEWWQTLGDETLTQLISQAFESNRDLQTARAKVLEARARLGIATAAFRPKAEGSAEYTHGRNSELDELRSYNKYSVGIDASWELDIFGKNQHTLDSAKANLESEYAGLNSAWVSLSAEVAMNYINLRILQHQLESLRHNVEIQSEILALMESQYNAGLKDSSGVQQEKYTLETTRAEIPKIEQSISETMNALAILTGEIPGSLNAKLSEVKPIPKAEDSRLIGIPAQTLRQRPDIMAAERKLAAQISARKSAQKASYPVIQLLGSIGLESLNTGDIFSSGAYNFAIGPKITWPIFSGGEIRKNIQVQYAVEEQLAAELEGVILRAVGEVRDALTANAQEIERNARLKAGLSAAREAMEIARSRYERGIAGFGEVLSAEKAVSDAEEECVASDGQKVMNLVILFKSLGGGWLKME